MKSPRGYEEARTACGAGRLRRADFELTGAHSSRVHGWSRLESLSPIRATPEKFFKR